MNLEQILRSAPVMPVIVIERLEDAVPLARALVAGGLPVLEVTLRTPVALQAIRAIADEVEGALVGVGTITRPEHFAQSLDAGALFGVSPATSPELRAAAADSELPFLPGVFSPSEAMSAAEAGYEFLKLFPAAQAGGVGMLKALSGPLPALRFCPTGGVSPGNFREFLALDNVICVGGSWVAPRELVAAGDWAAITELAAQASGKA
jgi:2-dehydro-3-deoxyphosphogluconate aldolase/(4S)-4-hydroxy-2-oxoglutarate aldolase